MCFVHKHYAKCVLWWNFSFRKCMTFTHLSTYFQLISVCSRITLSSHWLCSHGLESRSERRFGTWFGPFLILAHVNAKLFQIRLLKRVLKHEKRAVLDRDPPRKPDSRPCERKALSERDSCVCILKMRAEAIHKRMGQSARADCVVGAKYHSQCTDPDRDWKGVCSPCERT